MTSPETRDMSCIKKYLNARMLGKSREGSCFRQQNQNADTDDLDWKTEEEMKKENRPQNRNYKF